MFDFPNSPTVGQLYQGFTWDGEKWINTSQSALTWAPYEALGWNNLIINGAMELDQERGGILGSFASGAANQYWLDQWLSGKSGTMAYSLQQVIDAPPGFTYSAKHIVTTGLAVGSTDFVMYHQYIEGIKTAKLQWGTAGALPVTLAFATKIHRTGVYSGSIRNGAGNRSYPFTFTQNVADVWEYKSVTIPGDTTGTWVGNTSGIGMDVIFCIASGSTFLSPAGAWAAGNFLGATGTTNGVAATSDVFQITGVVLLPGVVAPSLAQAVLMKRPFDQELLLSKRYFYMLNNTDSPLSFYGYNIGTGLLQNNWLHPVAMRQGPTFTVNGTWTTSNCSQPVAGSTSPNGAYASATVTSQSAAQASPQSNATFTLNARM